MRILHIDTGRSWRGGQRQVLLLSQALETRGYDCTIAAPPDSELERRARAAGIATEPLAARADLDLGAVARLRRMLLRARADVVHAHDARGHAVALLALFGRRAPLVVTRRVAFRPRPGAKYGKRVGRFVAVSHAVATKLAAAGVSRERISIVYDGVPAPAGAAPVDWRERCGWPADAVLCGIAGAMTPEKGIADLAAIGESLTGAGGDRLRLVVIGGAGPPGPLSFGPLRAYAAGFVDDVEAAMAGLDMLWHPARSEGLGTVLLDAMALGLPPVAYAVGGIPEVVEHGVSGVLVPAGDTVAFAAAVARLAQDSRLRAALGAGGRIRAAGFSVARMTDGNAAVYQAVLPDTGKPRG